jgi:hypothetical protein
MVNSKFSDKIDKKQSIEHLKTAELKAIIDEFPYFQAARALYLKGLKNQDSFKYNNELKKTAAYTSDRTVLFDFITSKKFNTQKEDVRQQTREVKAPEIIKREEDKLAESNLKPITKVKEKLEIGKPISFTNSENHSFNQWLQLSTKKPIIRKEISKEGSLKKVDIIEKFIQSNPKIRTIPKDKSVSISVSKNKQDSSLMTETLAKVYLEQKKYENAIQAYRILSLKYPEKSGFFADQIKRIQILQKNKP